MSTYDLLRDLDEHLMLVKRVSVTLGLGWY